MPDSTRTTPDMEPIEFRFASSFQDAGKLTDEHVPARMALANTMIRYGHVLDGANQPGRANRAFQMAQQCGANRQVTLNTPGEARDVRDAIDDRLIYPDGSRRTITGEDRDYTPQQQASVVETLRSVRDRIVSNSPIMAESYELHLSGQDVDAIKQVEQTALSNRMNFVGDNQYEESVLKSYSEYLGVDEIIRINGPDEIETETGVDLPPGNPFDVISPEDFAQPEESNDTTQSVSP